MESLNHIIELEGSPKGHIVQPPCNDQGHSQLCEIAQSLVQPDVCRDRASTTSLGNLFQCFTNITLKTFFHYIYSKSPLF